jgi:hypothetical protein
MFSNDHGQIFAVSDRVPWSWPATPVAAMKVAESLMALAPSDMVDRLVQSGFRGVFIDRFGYPDNAVYLTTELTDYLGYPPMNSANVRYAFFSLENGAIHCQNYEWGTALIFTPSGNARRYLRAGWTGAGGIEGKESTMSFNAAPPSEASLSAHGSFQPSSEISQYDQSEYL